MSLQTQLEELEERFWRADADFYGQHVLDHALFVFGAPVGTLPKEQAVAALAGAPRWNSVKLDHVQLLQLHADAIVLTYEAAAEREGSDAVYRASVSSAYVRQGDGSWQLAFHQQTPRAAAARPSDATSPAQGR